MDTLAHGLWAYIIARGIRVKQRWITLGVVSAGPDLVWLPFTFLTLVTTGQLGFNQAAYNVSHSLVVWLILTVVVSLRWKTFWRWSWPWALHILIDIPGHIDGRTPFLWPVSTFQITGRFDWLTSQFLFVNYCVLLLIFFLIVIRERKKKKVSA